MHQSAISQEMLKTCILDMGLNNTNLTQKLHLPGANELIYVFAFLQVRFCDTIMGKIALIYTFKGIIFVILGFYMFLSQIPLHDMHYWF